MGVCLILNPQTLFVEGLVAITSISSSWSSFTVFAASYPLFLVFLWDVFDGGVAAIGLIVSSVLLVT
jgi:hypothetical protein